MIVCYKKRINHQGCRSIKLDRQPQNNSATITDYTLNPAIYVVKPVTWLIFTM